MNRIIAKNIPYPLDLKNRTQLDLAEYMNVSHAAVSNWCRGEKMPRMKKIDMICKYFGISHFNLMENKNSKKDLTSRDTKQIEKIIANTEQLLSQEKLMFDGNPADPETVDSIISAMRIGMEMAKKKKKEKYTPKNYKTAVSF